MDILTLIAYIGKLFIIIQFKLSYLKNADNYLIINIKK